MPSDSFQPIRDALKAGDKQTAGRLLTPLIRSEPTAEIWYLAAQACPTKAKAITCLRRALELDPFHNGANRLLFKLEGAKPSTEEEQPTVEVLAADLPPLKPVRRKKRRSTAGWLVLISLLLFGMSCSLITMNMVGIITGPITAITTITGGPTPVSAIDGVPLADVEDAPLRVEPSQVKAIQRTDTNVIEPGYAHEYTFSGAANQEVALYVQFLSVAANRVSRNVALLRPDGSDASALCHRDAILQGDNNITLTCSLDTSGTWKIRILGRNGESVGVYFVGVEGM